MGLFFERAPAPAATMSQQLRPLFATAVAADPNATTKVDELTNQAVATVAPPWRFLPGRLMIALAI